MADAPWRCSQCGTINEPVANSCRTCGKWPSLFDIQDSIVEDVARTDSRAPAPFSPTPAGKAPFEPDVLEPDVFEPDTEPESFEPEPFEPEPTVDPYELDDEHETPDPRRRQWLGRLVVPVVFALIVLVNALFGNR